MINFRKKLGRGLASIAIASGFAGCDLSTPVNQKEVLFNEYNSKNIAYADVKAEAEPQKIETPYFQSIPHIERNFDHKEYFGDFDNDGDTDYIVFLVPRDNNSFYSLNSYFFENDGKGNFTLKPKTYTK